MSRPVLTVVPGSEGLRLRVRGGDEITLTPACARQLAALLLVQAEHIRTLDVHAENPAIPPCAPRRRCTLDDPQAMTIADWRTDV